jgi:hypothetical protein
MKVADTGIQKYGICVEVILKYNVLARLWIPVSSTGMTGAETGMTRNLIFSHFLNNSYWCHSNTFGTFKPFV